MGVRAFAVTLILLLGSSLAYSESPDAGLETVRIPQAVSVHVAGDDSRGDTFRYEPPAGYHASMTARDYTPQVAQTRESLDAATKAAQAVTQQIHDLPGTAHESSKEAAKGALAGVSDTAARTGLAVAVAPVAVPGTIIAEGLKKVSPQNEDALNNLEKNLNPFKWTW